MIRIMKPSLDDELFEGNPVLRGVIDPDSLPFLEIDKAYQREFLASSTRRNIIRGLNQKKRLPDLELGMRGDTFEMVDSETLILKNRVFIIDGQQRRGSILEFLARFPDSPIRQGVIVHFNTTMDSEKERFHALNLFRRAVSTTILIRNARNENPGVATLYGLSTNDKEFPLYDRVCWDQTGRANHLISGSILLNLSLLLHSHLTPARSGELKQMIIAAATLIERIGMARFRSNIKVFWDTIDSLWGIKSIERRGPVWMKTGFLVALTNLFCLHLDFWKGDEFFVPYEEKTKLKRFSPNDPEIIRLAGAAGLARVHLHQLMVNFINKGRRTGRLRARSIAYSQGSDGDGYGENAPIPLAAVPLWRE